MNRNSLSPSPACPPAGDQGQPRTGSGALIGDNVTMDVRWPEAPAPGSVVRLAVRVLLVDQEDRVLLFRYSAHDGERFWCTPGGGIDANESPCDAARREVLRGDRLGRCALADGGMAPPTRRYVPGAPDRSS